MNPTIGKEAVLQVGGKTYTLARFDRAVMARFLAWAETKLPNPLDVIATRIKDFPPDMQKIMVESAMTEAKQRRNFESPEVQSLMQTPEAVSYLFFLLFQKHHAGTTLEQAEAIYDAACDEHGEYYVENKLREAQGMPPIDPAEVQRSIMQKYGLIPPEGEKKG